MPCPHIEMSVSETASAIRAVLNGTIAMEAVPLLTSFARRVRQTSPPKSVQLEIAADAELEDTGLAGILAVEEAAAAAGLSFEIRAGGAHAAELLARAGLARVLYKGP